jgi:hypothetical protein
MSNLDAMAITKALMEISKQLQSMYQTLQQILLVSRSAPTPQK